MKTVLLPVKDFARAKQRLTPHADAATRAGLARAMLSDVLNALTRARAPQRVVVFTACDEAIRMTRSLGFDMIIEKSVDGHSAAVHHMLDQLSGPSSRLLS